MSVRLTFLTQGLLPVYRNKELSWTVTGVIKRYSLWGSKTNGTPPAGVECYPLFPAAVSPPLARHRQALQHSVSELLYMLNYITTLSVTGWQGGAAEGAKDKENIRKEIVSVWRVVFKQLCLWPLPLWLAGILTKVAKTSVCMYILTASYYWLVCP